MSAFDEAVAAARWECLAQRDRERRRVDNMSTELVIHEMRAAGLEQRAHRQEAARRRLGAPEPGGSFAKGTAGLPGPRHAFFVSSFRNASFRP
jgi:hypothetical protein